MTDTPVRRMSSDWVFAALLLAIVGLVWWSGAKPRIGILHTARLIEEAGLKTEVDRRMAQVDTELAAQMKGAEAIFVKRRDDLVANSTTNDNAETQLAELGREAQEASASMRGRASARRRAALETLNQHLRRHAATVAARRRVHAIFDSGAGLVYSHASTDITGDMVPLVREHAAEILKDLDAALASVPNAEPAER